MKTMPVEPKWLRAGLPRARAVGVDREKKAILGYVVAQEGPFKDRRGEFDARGLEMIAEQINATSQGLKSRFSHPTLSDDGIGKFLGRSSNARVETAYSEWLDREVKAVRADLYFSDSAFRTPSGDLAGYLMDLAESDPAALSSSLVIEPEEVEQVDLKGRPLIGEDGKARPALWFPRRLHASDIVDTGDAVDALLSAGDGLPDDAQRQGAKLLDMVFAGQSREVVEARASAYLARYLEWRFGPPPAAPATPRLDALRTRLARLA